MVDGEAVAGVVTVEPTVLETIVRLTATEVQGVVDIAERDVDRFLSGVGKSVCVEVKDGRVTVDVHIVAGPDQSLLQLGRNVQREITRAIQQMVGMTVDAVNVYIEDVVYPEDKGQTPSE